MAYCCMKYRLTEQGKIPGFLYLGELGVGGVFGVKNASGDLSDETFVGIGFDDQPGDYEIVATKQALTDYLESISANWFDSTGPNVPEDLVPFDPVANATWVWDRLEALQAM